MELTIQIPDLPAFLSDVNAANAQAQTLANSAIQNSVNYIQQKARDRAPHKTGALQRSIMAFTEYPEGRVTVQERYGVYIELGTRAHVILPTAKKALYWKGAMHPVRKVNHPGTPARPFFQPAVDESRDYVDKQFQQVIQIITDKMAGQDDNLSA